LSAIRTKKPLPHYEVQIETCHHLMVLNVKQPVDPDKPARGGRRGRVAAFSDASRRRLLRLFARIDYEKHSHHKPLLITLTYPDLKIPSHPSQAQAHRRSFLERLRRAFPESSGIWRREQETRKSGLFPGRIAPHFHMIIFGVPYIHHDTINQMWREIINCTGYCRTDIQALKSYRHAFSYVSKYVAKIPDEELPADFLIEDSDEVEEYRVWLSLVNGAYLHAGRWWGVFNKDFLPLAEAIILQMKACKKTISDFRRAAAKSWRGMSRKGGLFGCSLFVTNADKWFDYWLYLVFENDVR